AEAAYRRAIKLDKGSADSHLQMGHALKLLRRFDEAAASYRMAAQIDPDSEDARREVAELAHAQSHPGSAQFSPTEMWKARFKVAEFRALNPELTRDVRTREEAYARFLKRGIDMLAPIAVDARFDPDFYRARYADAAGFSPAVAYRHWLFTGIANGRSGSAAEVYQRELIGRPAFAANFDWQSYAKTLPPNANGESVSQLEAVEHLLQHGYAEGAPIGTTDGNPTLIYELIADYNWGRGNRDVATKALLAAIAATPSAGRLYHKLGDYQIEQHQHALADASFDRALALGYRSPWTYVHLIDAAIRVGDVASAYKYLEASRDTCAGEAIWRRKLEEVVSTDFNQGAATNRAILKSPLPDLADTQFVAVLERITAAYRALDDLPARLPPAPDGHVVMFCLHMVPQCRHYRVEQRCEQLDALGIDYKLFAGDRSTDAREALVGARALLIYREPATPGTIRLILHAQAMGIPTFYEIDDLVFDAAHYPEPFETLKDQVGYEDYVGLLQGRTLYRFAMALCDEGIASTQSLARHIAKVVRSGICHHVPNGLDSRNQPFLDAPRAAGSDKVLIFYGSGTKTHNRNFNVSAGPALVDVLRERPNARLVIVGYLDLDPAFLPLEQQIIRLDFNTDVSDYWALLSKVDVNLALLVPGEMNDCKSEIKWLEAAVVGVPSVVSSSATYRESLQDGVDVLMVSSVDEMRDALFRLVDDADLRREIGTAARARAIAEFSLESTARRVGGIFGKDLAARTMSARPAQLPVRRTTRVMVVNVFFAPQSFGGATRVVEDNVDGLISHYGEEFEVAVFTTDTGAAPNSTRVSGHQTVPVFRIWPVLGQNPERDFDRKDVAAYFSAVIAAWQPDIVHFHCIQYLTGSLCAVCTSRDVPYVVTVHDGWWLSEHQFFLDKDHFLQLPSQGERIGVRDSAGNAAGMRRKHFLGSQLAKAEVVLAVSESFADIYRRAGTPNVRAIPNGLSPIFASGSLPRRTGSERVRIGHVAGWAYHKGIHLFQAALMQSDFGNIEAIVVDHMREESYRLEVVWGTTPVLIRGKVAQERMVDLYAEIDVLAAPSIWPESYGLVSREALQCGAWVIASNLGAIAEDIVEGENGFVVDVSDARGLIEAFSAIDRQPHRYKQPPPLQVPIRLASDQVDELAELYRSLVDSDAAIPSLRDVAAA
ncbi:MAG: glycosyl transferase group 1, partial [Sphingomonas bacterium]|nr:glycosyl transferase group 1 [Sphingomonas bacterium]